MVECTIKEFHDFIKSKGIELRKENIYVETRKGNHRVLDVDITEPNSKYSSLIINNDKFLLAHKDHLVFKIVVGWTPVKRISPGDEILTEDGYSKIQLKSNYNERVDLYDLQVEDVEEYYTNGIVSHNSTLSDVIKLGFYGKAKDKPLAKVPNRFNKYGEIDLTFKSGNKTVTTKRKFEPSSFDVLEGKKPVDISSKPELQKYLEVNHLKMPYHIFDNMVSLSLHDFKSFLKMKPEDKRKIIDQVFSMAIINEMRKEVKTKKSKMQRDVEKTQSTLRYVDSVIEKTQQEIISLNESLSQKKEDKSQELEEKIADIKSKKDKAKKKLDSIKLKVDSEDSKLSGFKSSINDLNYELRQVKEDLSLYDDGTCPTCGSDLTTGDHGKHKTELETKLAKIKEDLDAKKEERDKQQELVDKIDNDYYALSDKINKMKNVEYKLVTELNEQNQDEVEDDQTESLQRILDDNVTKREEYEEKVKKGLSKVKFYIQADSILSEDGVKKSIISTIIPELNANINDYLEKFDLTFRVEFSNKFESIITQHGETIGTGEISLGESKIFDFCVLISLIRILKSKYYNLNVLFLDEIFASLDTDNVIFVLKILKNFSKDYKLNTFVINHAPLPKEYFDNFIQINKDRFSNLEYVEDF